MAKYLVTGGAGFIGSHIAETIVKHGESVRILDNLLTGRMENLVDFIEKIEFIEGDIRDLDVCRRAVAGVDYVLHQAALPSVPRSVADPLLTNSINIAGTLNLLIAARDAGVRRFVHASSSSVYGDDPSLKKVEGREGVPLSPYANSKKVGERFGREFYSRFGFPVVSLRYFNVFGPRQNPFSQYAAVIPLFITQALKGEQLTIYGNGEQTRDFTYIDNVVAANLLAANTAASAGETINVACGEQLTVNALLDSISEILGVEVEAHYAPARPGDVLHSSADYEKARRLLGFRPEADFATCLRRTVEWYRERS